MNSFLILKWQPTVFIYVLQYICMRLVRDKHYIVGISFASWSPAVRSVKEFSLLSFPLSCMVGSSVTCFLEFKESLYVLLKARRSANLFCKSQLRKFAVLINLSFMRSFRKCDILRICDLRTQTFLWFADLNLPQICKYIPFSFQLKHIKLKLNRRLEIFWDRVVQFFVKICDLRFNHTNKRICDLRTGILKKLADLRQRKELNIVRICDLRTLKTSSLAHLWYFCTLHSILTSKCTGIAKFWRKLRTVVNMFTFLRRRYIRVQWFSQLDKIHQQKDAK